MIGCFLRVLISLYTTDSIASTYFGISEQILNISKLSFLLFCSLFFLPNPHCVISVWSMPSRPSLSPKVSKAQALLPIHLSAFWSSELPSKPSIKLCFQKPRGSLASTSKFYKCTLLEVSKSHCQELSQKDPSSQDQNHWGSLSSGTIRTIHT